MSPGLFHRAILQSGSPSAFWSAHNESVDLASHVKLIIQGYGCDDQLREKTLQCLRGIPWEYLDSVQFPVK